MIVGLAGHVDHGKSALVEALTGRRMDPLAEERRRGITLDLHVADLALPDGRRIGLVDVPGHEDLVRTMVAGASGIDAALLVIAADEGIMPQTAEHLLVLEQLGVAQGVPILSKADLVEPDWLDLVRDDVARRLAASSVRWQPPLAASARTGQGLEAVRAALAALAAALPERTAGDLFRLPVDRHFSVAGTGTVAAGTAWSGTVAVGEAVRLLPDGREVRVRSVERHGEALERSAPGARIALGLHGVHRDEVPRGTAIVGAGEPWRPAARIDVELRLDASAARPLARRARVRVLHGTREVLARVSIGSPLAPGQAAACRLHLEAPLVARGGDRFVVRSYSPVRTIGGGVVLDPDPPARRAGDPAALLAASDPADRLLALAARRRDGLLIEEVPLVLGVPPVAAAEIVARATALLRLGDRLLPRARLEQAEADALARVAAHHVAAPAEAGVPLEELRRALRAPGWLAEAAIGRLVERRQLRVADGRAARKDFVAKPGASPEDVRRLVAEIAAAGLAPPSVAELRAAHPRVEVWTALQVAAKAGELVAVERERFFAAAAVEGFLALVRDVGRASGDVSPAELRERTGLSRKFLIPLLEWSDRQGVTIRQGEGRRLRVRA